MHGKAHQFFQNGGSSKTTGAVEWIEALQQAGVSAKYFLRYLVICLRNVASKQDLNRGVMGLTVDHACAPVLTEALRQA